MNALGLSRITGAAALIFLVVVFSSTFTEMWQAAGAPAEEGAPPRAVSYEPGMTVQQFGDVNAMSRPELKALFGLTSPADLEKPVTAFVKNPDPAAAIAKKLALAGEKASKNWLKIPLKFGLWFVMLAAAFVYMIRGAKSPRTRFFLYLAATGVFGVVLGADPSPMGTVKDTFVTFGRAHIIFPPRLVAFTIFILTVVIANKFICAWGCQAGTLQDALFRMNRPGDTGTSALPQYKIPFALTNTVRAAFFVALAAGGLVWGLDLVKPVDPFTVFHPQVMAGATIFFLALLFGASLFVYRPWCHFFCPFGFVGWVFEKIAVFRIHVNYDTCIACGACERACPSPVMGAILKRNAKTVPDCFACGTCIPACPTKSVSFRAGIRRESPPPGKFR